MTVRPTDQVNYTLDANFTGNLQKTSKKPLYFRILVLFLVAKILYNLNVCPSETFGGNVIKYRRLKLLVNIPIKIDHL